jgi:hypothetical protein
MRREPLTGPGRLTMEIEIFKVVSNESQCLPAFGRST